MVAFYEGQAFEFALNLAAMSAMARTTATSLRRCRARSPRRGFSRRQGCQGQRLLTLEAMKMEHGLVAPFDGTVAELSAKAGQQVAVDAVLVRVEPSDG